MVIRMLLMVMVLCSAEARAQHAQPQLQFDHIRVKDGLTSDSITAIVQDTYGFIWIGTKYGLNRYDGHRITQYLHQKSNVNSIASNNISCLFADSDGSLWIGYRAGGVDRFNIQTHQIVHYIHKPGKQGSISEGVVRKIIRTSPNDYWMVLYEGGLNHFNVKTSRFSCYNKTNLNGLENNRIMDVVEYDATHLLIATWDNGGDGGENTVMRFNTKYKTLERYFDKELSHDYTKHAETRVMLRLVNRIKKGQNGEIAGASFHGFWIYDSKLKSMRLWSCHNKSQNPFPFTQINDLQIDNVDVWLGSDKDGLIRYNRKFNSFYAYKSNRYNEFSMSSNKVVCVYNDQAGNLWIGTEDGGVNILKAGYRHSLTYANHPTGGVFTNPPPHSGDYFKVLSDWSLIYSNINKLARINLVTGEEKSVLEYGNNNEREYFMGYPFKVVDFGEKAIVFRNGYFYIYNPFNNEIMAKLDIPKSDGVYEINTKNGIYIIRAKTNGKKVFYSNNKKLARVLNTYAVHFSGHGRFVLFTPNSGAYFANQWVSRNIVTFFNDSAVYRAFAYSSRLPGLEANHKLKVGYTFLEAKDGSVWMISDGIIRYEHAANQFRNYPNPHLSYRDVEDALALNADSVLLVYKDRITIANLRGSGYSLFVGLHFPCNYFEAQVAICPGQESFIVKTDVGFILFHPDVLRKAGVLRAPVVSGFKVFNHYIATDTAIHVKRSVTLGHDENNITIQFSSLCYQATKPVRYAYQLEGFDLEWKYCGSQSEVHWNNLAPGKYAFRLKYTADGIHWIENAQPLIIVIRPPYWTRWWFILSSLLLISGIIYFIVSYRIRNIKRLYELRLKISSDLHDDVGGMLTLLAMKAEVARQTDPESSRLILSQITENAREALTGMRDVIWSFDSRTDTVHDLFQRIANLARETETVPNKSYTVKKQIERESFRLSLPQKKNLLLMSKEIITNFIKHSDGTRLDIDFTLEGKMLRISFKDNGTKRMNDEQLHGFGLKNLRLRAKELDGEITFTQNGGFGVTIALAL